MFFNNVFLYIYMRLGSKRYDKRTEEIGSFKKKILGLGVII